MYPNYTLVSVYSFCFLNFQDAFSYSWVLLSSYAYIIFLKTSSSLSILLNFIYTKVFRTTSYASTGIASNPPLLLTMHGVVGPHKKYNTLLNNLPYPHSTNYTHYMYCAHFLNSYVKSSSLSLLEPIYLFSASPSNLSTLLADSTVTGGGPVRFLALPLYISTNITTPVNSCNIVRPGTSFLLTANTKYTSLISSDGIGMDTSFLKPSYSLASTLNSYKFKNINIDLYFTKNLLSNLNSSKQVRWLTRFAWTSNSLFQDLAKFTHLKKIYGNPLLNTGLTNSHLWGSNYLTGLGMPNLSLSDSVKTSGLEFGQSNIYKNSLSNLNQFEESSMFLIKRFSQLNFRKLNILSQYQGNYSLPLHNSVPSSNFLLWLNLYLLGLPNPVYFGVESVGPSLGSITALSKEKSLLTPHTLFFLRSYFSNLSFQKNTTRFYSNLEL